MTRQQQRRAPTTAESLQEYGRGVGGGFLFSLPLLYTMEVWGASFTIPPGRLALAVLGTLLLLCGYNLFAGLRHDSTISEVLIDSVEELGIGLALSAALLYALNRFPAEASTHEILALIVLEGLFVAIGVSVGTAQLSSSTDENAGGPQGRHQTIWSEIVLAVCGAVLIAANIAPTEEIQQLASEMRTLQLVATMAVSMALAGALLFYSDFKGSGRFAGERPFLHVAHGSGITYAAALFASAALLWFFGRFAGHGAALNAAQTVVLGLPGTLGAAAGRLLLR